MQHPPVSKQPPQRRLPRTRSAAIRLGGLVLILVITALVGHRLGWFDYRHTFEHVERLRRDHSFAGFALAFVLVFGLGSALGMPGLPFVVAAGALFGTVLGSALAWAGAMAGAAIGYLIARTIGHDIVVRWLKRFRRVDTAVAQARDFGGMLRLRLLPVLPLGIVNFVGGLARAPFIPYFGATALGIIPSTLIYAYFADSFLMSAGPSRTNAIWSAVIASVLLLGLTLAPKFLRSR